MTHEPEQEPEDALERARELYDEGRLEDALDELARLDPRDLARGALEALVRTELGDLRAARELVDRLAGRPGARGDPDWLWAAARLCLREWRVGEARGLLQKLVERERSPAALEELALCAELAGDLGRAERLFREAHRLDPETPLPPRLSHAAFGRVIEEAIAELPPRFRDALEAAEVVVEPVPSRDLVDARDAAETPPDMLGMFAGASQLERGGDAPELPPRIYLFQRNLERACRDQEQLADEIRVTLLHEIGHMLGFDEEGVAELGLE